MATGFPDWLRAFVLLGKFSNEEDEYVAIKVKETGELYAVLQGEFEDALETVALDSEGRMQAVVIDTRDPWGLAGTIGLSEVTSRLGAHQRFDTRGVILWAHGFENGMPAPSTVTPGGGATSALSAGDAAHGGYCYAFTLPGGGPGTGELATAVSTADPTQVGLEAAVRVADVRGQFDLYLSDQSMDGYNNAGVRVDTSDGKFYYYDSGGGWTEFEDLKAFPVIAGVWARAKFVVDCSTHKYVRFLLDRHAVDMTALSCQSGVAGAPARIDVKILVRTDSSIDNVISIDNLILTNHEPANPE